MIIEIRNVGFVNKGAELMLYSILDKMRKIYPTALYAMAPNIVPDETPFSKRAELGLFQKASFWYKDLQFGKMACVIPQSVRNMYGIVLDSEIDVVLDASGFLYSDQWEGKYTRQMANSCKRWNLNKTKIILLPQAFGPFNSSRIKEDIKIIVSYVDLIFARDNISYQNLIKVVGERPNIKEAPDFTNVLMGNLPGDFDIKNNKFCIIPNYRMIDKTTKEESQAYLPLLIKCAYYLLENNIRPFILVHGGKDDLNLAQKISGAVGGKLSIIANQTH